MRIALRTSGGRGEYELTGEHAGVAAADLFGRRLAFELTPELTIDGRQRPDRFQGKPRIRLEGGGRHAYRVLADVLLMPVPRRELRLTADGQNFVRDGGYAVHDIDVDLASANGQASLRPTRMWLTNAEGLARSIEFAERMASVQAVWAAARDQEGRLAGLLRAHESAVEDGDHSVIGTATGAIRREFGTGTDVLPLVGAALGVEFEDAPPEGGAPVDGIPEEGAEERDPEEAIRRVISKWRKQAVRDAAGRQFAELVKSAYDYRCVVCSHRYPKLDSATSAGVDGAHILPYRRYDLNDVVNGLCLCKICHWAFDNAIFRIDYRRRARQYAISIPRSVRDESRANAFDLTYFEQFEGPVARARLPQADALWPSPAYLAELNEQVYGR